MAKKSRGATTRKVRSKEKVSAWRYHHQQMALDSIKTMLAKPLSSALTWMVIAISLSLPSLLFVALANISDKTADLQKGGRITLFLQDYVSEPEALSLMQSLQGRPEIASVRYISKTDAWASLQEQFNGQDINALVNENPLPAAIEVIPQSTDLESLERLQLVLQDLGGVGEILVDLAWIERLNYWLDLIQTVVWIFAGLLGLTVLLVVGNTIRLNIEAQRDKIIIEKLVGATNSFVRRGFLYMGFWYGLIGAFGAWFIVFICSYLIQQPLTELKLHYDAADFLNMQWSLNGTFYLFIGSISCAMIGAWLAVWRHLRDIRPT